MGLSLRPANSPLAQRDNGEKAAPCAAKVKWHFCQPLSAALRGRFRGSLAPANREQPQRTADDSAFSNHPKPFNSWYSKCALVRRG
jgi:hypothetical protein